MANDSNSSWKERLHRGQLTAAELHRVRSDMDAKSPEAEDLSEEWALEQALASLPRPSTSSNFTASVLREIEREDKRAEPWRQGWLASIQRWLRPNLAFGALALIALA